MIPYSTRPFALVAALLGSALPSLLAQQSLQWRGLANPSPIVAAYDAGRQQTVLVGTDTSPGPSYSTLYRHWQWDGTALRECLGALSATPQIQWLGHDPRRGELVALARNPQRIGTWNGVRWSWQIPAAAAPVTSSAYCTFDEHRGRLVAVENDQGACAVFEWDGSQWWGPLSSPSGPAWRWGTAFAYDPVGRRCVLYGGDSATGTLGDFWSWDGSSWSLLATNAPPGTRSGASMAYAQALGGLLLYGGIDANGALPTSTWQLQGNTWTQRLPAHDPGPLSYARLVPGRFGVMLLYSGPTGTAWHFDGTDWTPLTEAFHGPRLSTFSRVAFDPVRGQTLHYAGNYPFGATSVFDTRWRATAPTQSPPPRNGAQLCWSSVEQQILLFGGVDGTNTALADTWSWDGTTWVQRSSPVAPAPRYNAITAEDPRGGVLLFGGYDGTTVFGDHWHWNGASWQQMAPATQLGTRSGTFAALDPLRNRTVLLAQAPNSTTDTWEWDGSTWLLAATSAILQPLWSIPLAFDPQRGRVIGSQGNRIFEWNGTTWTGAPITPSITSQHRLVTDLVRQRVLSFGEAVAVLTTSPAAATAYGAGCALGPSPGLLALGDPRPGNAEFQLELGALSASAPTFLVLGFTAQNVALGSGCASLVGGPTATRFALASPGGQAVYPVPIPNAAGLLGVTFQTQGAVVEPARSLLGTVTLTAGLQVTVGD